MTSNLEILTETSDALEFATRAHSGQTRSDGSPYINHPIAVAENVVRYKDAFGDELIDFVRAAYLHDTLEDTETTFEELENLFGSNVAQIVLDMTSDKEQIKIQGKTEYLKQKMSKMRDEVLALKLCDRLHNVEDIKTAKSEKWRKKYRAETSEILQFLNETRNLTIGHHNIIRSIILKLV